MPKENTGSRSIYAKSLIPGYARHFSALPPDQWPAEIDMSFQDFRVQYHSRMKSGCREFASTMKHVVSLTKATPEVVMAAHQHIDTLASTYKTEEVALVSPEVVKKPEVAKEVDPIDAFLNSVEIVDLNAVPRETESSPLRTEMLRYHESWMSQWTEDRPFYIARSTVDPSVVFINTSIGRNVSTGVKTNVDIRLSGRSFGFNSLPREYKVTENGRDMVKSNDHTDGRTYYTRPIRLLEGPTLLIWKSIWHDNTSGWERVAERLLQLLPNTKAGFSVIK